MKNPFSSITSTRTQPIEVGDVRWNRELDDALELSAAEGKPVFALFQEVPGCAGCKQFGKDVLSNPLVVKAIESAFVPLLIHNNTGGRDAEVLAAYGEPAWNFQVVRFLDASGADIIERKDKVWETGPLVERMVQALDTAGATVPNYLRLLEQENSHRLEEAFIVQGCFWVGEMELGKIDGVVTTEAGFMGGHEVTRVQFDPEVTSLSNVVRAGANAGVASAVFAEPEVADGVNAQLPTKYRVAPKSDQKRQVRGRYAVDEMSLAQATKVNAFASTSKDIASSFLPDA